MLFGQLVSVSAARCSEPCLAGLEQVRDRRLWCRRTLLCRNITFVTPAASGATCFFLLLAKLCFLKLAPFWRVFCMQKGTIFCENSTVVDFHSEQMSTVFLHNKDKIFLFFNTLLVCHYEFKIRHEVLTQFQRYYQGFRCNILSENSHSKFTVPFICQYLKYKKKEIDL